MRFAWLRKTKYSDHTFASKLPSRIVLILYNFIWWIPVVLPFIKVMSYHAGFIAFFFITMVRALLNVYRINMLPPEKGILFPFRQP